MFDQSKKFFSEFNKIFEDGSLTQREAIEKYTNLSEFTTFIIDEIKKIIDNIDNDYHSQKEYFRIDAIGYKLIKLKETKKGFKHHCWDLKIAVEHENDSKDWLDEVIKIAHICCPLRVVIGYVPMHSRDILDKERLEYSSKALKKLSCKNNLKYGEFLIILGNSDTQGNKENYFNYKAYILNPETFDFESLEKYN